jgi:PAS domain S-box-containing protein
MTKTNEPGGNPERKPGDEAVMEAALEQLIPIFDNIDEKVYISDPETYKILYANPAKKAVFGQDILGQKCHVVFQGMDEPCDFCTNPLIFGSNLGKTHSWEFQNRKTGTWLRCIDRAIPWNGGRMARFEIAIDIHKRKLAEEALQESEQKYRELVENIHEVIYSMDEKGVVTYVSPAIQSLTGFSPSEIEGLHFSQFIFKDDFDLIVQRFGEALSGQKSPTEYRLVAKSGDPVWVRSMSKPIQEGDEVKGLRGVLSDISEQKKAEAALQESRKHYRELLETMNEGFSISNEDGIQTYANRRLCEMLGCEMEEIVNHPVTDMIDGEGRKLWEKQFEKRKSRESSPYQMNLVRKDGRAIPVLVSPKPLFDENGVFKGSFAALTDISELKKTEKSLKDRERELKAKAANLQEMNAALRVLLEKREKDKKELEESVLLNMKDQVIPYLEKLRRLLQDEKQKTYLDIVETHIRDITSSFSRDLHVKHLNLTHTELYISGLIRDGKTTGEIAELMNVSTRTVESHRKNIRKKMGLIAMKANLRTTLISLE